MKVKELNYVEKSWMTATTLENSETLKDKEDVTIDTERINTLFDHMNSKDNKYSEIDDARNLVNTFVVPINYKGKQMDVIVNSDGEDIACVVKDHEGKENIELAKTVKEKIDENTSGFAGILSQEDLENFIPKNMEELTDKILEDELIPKSPKEAAKIAGIKTEEELEIEPPEGEGITEGEPEQELPEGEELEEENEGEPPIGTGENKEEEFEEPINENNHEGKVNVPKELKDKVSEATGRDPSKITGVITILQASSLTNLGNTLPEEIDNSENAEKVYAIKFPSQGGDTLKEEHVLIQGETVVDNRRYDDKLETKLRGVSEDATIERLNDEKQRAFKQIGADGKEREVTLNENPNVEPNTMEMCEDELKKNEEQIEQVMKYQPDNKEILERLRENRVNILCKYGFAEDKVVEKVNERNIEESSEEPEIGNDELEKDDSRDDNEEDVGRVPWDSNRKPY